MADVRIDRGLPGFDGGVTAGDIGRRKQGKIKDGAKEADLDGT
jgi:hypothetical protein